MAYTEDFIRDNNNLINATVGDRGIVVAYDPEFKSVGVYYNDSDQAVSEINFWGESDQGKLQRVETVKAGLYWCVWVNYYPETDLNRPGVAAQNKGAEKGAVDSTNQQSELSDQQVA